MANFGCYSSVFKVSEQVAVKKFEGAFGVFVSRKCM